MNISAHLRSLIILVSITSQAQPPAKPTELEMQEMRLENHHGSNCDDPTKLGYIPLLNPDDDLILNKQKTATQQKNIGSGLLSHLALLSLIQSCCPWFGTPEPGDSY